MVRTTCRTCCQILDKKSRRTIFSTTFEVFQQLHEVLGRIPHESDGHSRYVCSHCYRILKKLYKIDYDLIHKLDELRKEKFELIKALRENLTLDNIQSTSESEHLNVNFTTPTEFVTSKDVLLNEDGSMRSRPLMYSPSPLTVERCISDANFSEVSVKLERLDQEYEYSNALQTEADTFTNIKTDPSEPDENYSVPTVSQCPPQIGGGSQTSISRPVISSPPIKNRAQLLNGGPNLLQVAKEPSKKQVVSLVKVAAPTSMGTTIKQEVNKACLKLSQDGEQSLFLSVNVEKKLTSYVGSDMGRQFLSKRPDIKEQFFKFCQVIYNTEKEYKTSETAMHDQSTQEKQEPKQVTNQPNILQQKGPPGTQHTMTPAHFPVAAQGRGTVPMTGNQLHSVAQPPTVTHPYLPPATKTKQDVSEILSTSSVTNIKGIIVSQSVESGRKRKITQKEGSGDEPLEKQPSPSGIDKPFRKNIKILNRGATKSMPLTLGQTLESKSGTGSTPIIIDKKSSTQQPRMSHEIGNTGSTMKKSPSYGEDLKKDVKTSLSENSSTYTTRKLTRSVKRTKKKPVKPGKNNFQAIKENSDSNPNPQEKTDSTPKPYSFRQRTKKKRFGDDYVEDFKKGLRVRTRHKGEMEKGNDEVVVCQGNTLHQCDFCKDVFIQRQDLLNHVTTHTLTFPYICKECGKGFKKKWKLNLHMISHVSHHPFQCDICGMSFKMEATLCTHIKHHKEIKPFKCNYCPLQFKSEEESSKHMLHKHITSDKLIKFKVYKCEYCNKLMCSKDIHMQHIQMHNKGESPFVFCDVCGRSFTKLAILNAHKKMHLERKYHCDICNFFCMDAHQFWKHFQTMRHKFKVEQKNHIRHLAESGERNMMKATEDTGVVDSISVKLEEDVSILEVPRRTQIILDDETVIVVRAADDSLQNERLQQGESSETEGHLQGYWSDTSGNLSSMELVPVEPYPVHLSKVQQSVELSNQIKEENMKA
ncbi:uncharacterized protein LOC133197674 [Saccostrea echinata]|uniref:uncharacterized protein LOC133197674 n=1 Tax=Saccostrea echinata TaxID=191078 RepID=UPI002A813640|nr:uncharacterized protein LOC133197674 [Saccostrea echinata]